MKSASPIAEFFYCSKILRSLRIRPSLIEFKRKSQSKALGGGGSSVLPEGGYLQHGWRGAWFPICPAHGTESKDSLGKSPLLHIDVHLIAQDRKRFEAEQIFKIAD